MDRIENIGTLASDFSSMAAALKEQQDKLLSYGRELESIIADRTAQLAHEKDNLELSVAERTCQLNAANDVLTEQAARLSQRNQEITLFSKMNADRTVQPPLHGRSACAGAPPDHAQQGKPRHRHARHRSFQDLGAISLSLGVSMFPEHGGDVVEAVKAADVALYQAKSNGRNRVVMAGASTGSRERVRATS